MKKVTSILAVFFSIFACMFGFSACSNKPREDYWLEGEKTLMSFLEVDLYTPVQNKTTINQKLRWKYIEGAQYTIKTDKEVLVSSAADYTIVPNQYCEWDIPQDKQKEILYVDYKLNQDAATSTSLSDVWKAYSWTPIENTTFYRATTNSNDIFTSNKNVYNSNQKTDHDSNCFEVTQDLITFRTTIKDKDAIKLFQYVEKADDKENNKALTRLDASLNTLFNDSKDKTNANIISAISDTTEGNIYRNIETKYLYLIRSCFVNVWGYGKLLETVPPTQTDDNASGIAKEFADLNNRVLNLQKTLNEIKSDFDRLKKYFNAVPDLKDEKTNVGAALLRFEKDVTPKIKNLIFFSEFFQDFCEKHYNITPNVKTMLEEINENAIDPLDPMSGPKPDVVEQEIIKLVKDNVITAETVKNMIIAYQNSLLEPIYNYYFTEYEGRYASHVDQRLFEKLVTVNDIIMTLSDDFNYKLNFENEEISTTTKSNVYTIINTLNDYYKIQPYLETEREIFLKGLANVELGKVNKIEWKDYLNNSNIKEWEDENKNNTYFVLVKLTQAGANDIYVPVHDLSIKVINNKQQISLDQVKNFLKTKYTYNKEEEKETYNGYTATFELYSITNDAFIINYNDRIINYLNNVINISENYMNTLSPLVKKEKTSSFYYPFIPRAVIEQTTPEVNE